MYKCKYPFPEDWEQRLQVMLLSRGNRDKKFYICSPLRGADWKEVHRNMLAARFYMYFTWLHMHRYARAPHAYMPLLYCDDMPKERSDAICSGMAMLATSNAVFVCGNRLAEGMHGEIEHAIKFDKQITVFDQALYEEIRVLFARRLHFKKLLVLNTDPRHQILALGTEDLFEEACYDL